MQRSHNPPNPFENIAALTAATAADPAAVIQHHEDSLQEVHSSAFAHGEKSLLKWLYSMGACMILLIAGFIAYVAMTPSIEAISRECLEYKQTLDAQVAGRAEDLKKIDSLENTIKVESAKVVELQSKLGLASSSLDNEIKAKLAAEKTLKETEVRVKDLSLLADKAKNADLYSSQADSARKERDEVKGKLEVAEAKIIDLQKSFDQLQRQNVANLQASELTTPKASQVGEYPGDAIFSRAPKGFAVSASAGEPQWKTAMKSFAQKARNDLQNANQAGGASPHVTAALNAAIAAFDAAANASLNSEQASYLRRFAERGNLSQKDVADINSALGASTSAPGPRQSSLRPN